MRIVDSRKQKDYYDCMMRSDGETEPLYIRKTEVVQTLKRYNFPVTIISFCGTLYPCVPILNKNYEVVDWDFTREGIAKARWSFWYNTKYPSLEDKMREYLGGFTKPDSPIWVVRKRDYDPLVDVIVNPLLREFNFAKIIPPPQAYQKLRQWLCNKASPEKSIPTVSNSDLIEAKGFHLKSSFRREKQKRK